MVVGEEAPKRELHPTHSYGSSWPPEDLSPWGSILYKQWFLLMMEKENSSTGEQMLMVTGWQ